MNLQDNSVTKWICGTLIALCAIAAYIHWTDQNDKLREVAVQKYETCVRDQYHTTPAAWYNEHGEYPDCTN